MSEPAVALTKNINRLTVHLVINNLRNSPETWHEDVVGTASKYRIQERDMTFAERSHVRNYVRDRELDSSNGCRDDGRTKEPQNQTPAAMEIVGILNEKTV